MFILMHVEHPYLLKYYYNSGKKGPPAKCLAEIEVCQTNIIIWNTTCTSTLFKKYY